MQSDVEQLDPDAAKMAAILKVIDEQYFWKINMTEDPVWKRTYNKHYFRVLADLIKELDGG